MMFRKLSILLTWLIPLQSYAQAALIDDVVHTGGHVDWPDLPYMSRWGSAGLPAMWAGGGIDTCPGARYLR